MELKIINVFNRAKSVFISNSYLIKSSFWILLGTVISKFLLLIASILVTDFVDKDVFGQFGFIRSTINMFTVFAGLGLGLTATKYIAEFKDIDIDKTKGILGSSNLFSFIISSLVAFLFLVFSKAISTNIGAPHLLSELRFSSIILFFSALNGIQTGILAGFEKFKIISTNSIIGGVFSAVLQVVGAYYYGLLGVVVGFGSNFLILYLLNYYSINKVLGKTYNYKIFSKENFKHLDILWKFSLPAVLSGLIISPIIWYSNKLLILEKNHFNLLAEFEIANQWRTTILFIPGALAQVALPMLSSSKNNFQSVFKKNLKINIILSLAISLVLILVSPYIINFYSPKYSTALVPLIIMIATTSLVAMNGIVSQALTSKNKLWEGLVFNIVWGFVFISSTYYLVSTLHLGTVGLAFSYLISYIFHTIIQYTYLNKIILKNEE